MVRVLLILKIVRTVNNLKFQTREAIISFHFISCEAHNFNRMHVFSLVKLSREIICCDTNNFI